MSEGRSLPELSLPGLPAGLALREEERRAVADVWTIRSAAELGAGCVFGRVAAHVLELHEVGAEVAWLAARAVSDEVRHAEICRAVASRYAGREVAWPRPRPSIGTRLPVDDEALGRVCAVVVQCCINETIGSAFLERCLAEAEHDLPRAAVRLLLRDEVDHGRIGWAVLAASSAKERIRPLLPRLVDLARDAWFERAAAVPDAMPVGHGCLRRDTLEELVVRSVDELVRPGFDHVLGG